MDLATMTAHAKALADRYDTVNAAAGRQPWTTGDLALGFVGDVGDLAKLVMAMEGRREIPDARRLLGHELADCLWSVLVLAERYGFNLADELTLMTSEVGRHLEAGGD